MTFGTELRALTEAPHSTATKEEIMESGVTVASLFFKNVFGKQAQRALSVFVALSALGVCAKVCASSLDIDLILHAERRYSRECEIQLQTLILGDLPYVRRSKQPA